MKKNKSSVSKAGSYREIGEYWDNHDFTEHLDQIQPIEFEVDIQSEKRYYSLERDLADQMAKAALKRGVAVETLLNLWIKEKLMEKKA